MFRAGFLGFPDAIPGTQIGGTQQAGVSRVVYLAGGRWDWSSVRYRFDGPFF